MPIKKNANCIYVIFLKKEVKSTKAVALLSYANKKASVNLYEMQKVLRKIVEAITIFIEIALILALQIFEYN